MAKKALSGAEEVLWDLSDLYDSGKLPGTDTAHTVMSLPFDGSLIHVRLKYKVSGSWNYIDASYTAVTWNIGITSIVPATGPQLKSDDVTFSWADSGGKVKKWRLLIGSGVGKSDYYDSGALNFG